MANRRRRQQQRLRKIAAQRNPETVKAMRHHKPWHLAGFFIVGIVLLPLLLIRFVPPLLIRFVFRFVFRRK